MFLHHMWHRLLRILLMTKLTEHFFIKLKAYKNKNFKINILKYCILVLEDSMLS